MTSLGHGPTGKERRALGITTEGPVLIVTDLCLMRPDPETHEFEVASIHPGATLDRVREQTGWPVKIRQSVEETPPPRPEELDALRTLQARTRRAHGAETNGA
jgi:glutaconate CoA-transferase subunit B